MYLKWKPNTDYLYHIIRMNSSSKLTRWKTKQAYTIDTSLKEMTLSQMVLALWQFAMLSYNKSKSFISAMLIVMSQKPEEYSDLVVLAYKINLLLSSKALGHRLKCWAYSSEKSCSHQIASTMKEEAFWITLSSHIKIV